MADSRELTQPNVANGRVSASAGWLVLTTISVGTLSLSLNIGFVYIATPLIGATFGLTAASAVWVVTAFQLAICCALVAAAQCADSLGHRRVYLWGLILSGVAGGACAQAGSFNTLIAWRAAQGIGSAMVLAAGPAIVLSTFPPARVGRALGITQGALYVGMAVGPAIAGIVAGVGGWRPLFAILAVVSTVGAVLAFVTLAKDVTAAKSARQRVDVSGAFLLALAMGLVLIAIQRAVTAPWQELLELLGGGVLALCAFVYNERRSKSPLVPFHILRTPSFALGLASGFVVFVVTFMPTFLLPYYLQRFQGVSAARAGALMSIMSLATTAFALVGGVVADRVSPRVSALSGTVTVGLGMATLVPATNHGFAALAVALGVVGAGVGLFSTPNLQTLIVAAPAAGRALSNGLWATARNLGMTAGVALASGGFGYLMRPGSAGTAASAFASVMHVGAALSVVSVVLTVLQTAAARRADA